PAMEFPAERVREELAAETRVWLELLVHRAAIGADDDPARRFLARALNERLDQAMNRIFRELALILPPKTMYAAYRGLRSDRSGPRGHALEYLENALDPQLRAQVLPLVNDTPDDQRLRLAETLHGFRPETELEALEALLEGDDPWLRACTLYVVGRHGERTLRTRVETNLDADDRTVRETAAWA